MDFLLLLGTILFILLLWLHQNHQHQQQQQQQQQPPAQLQQKKEQLVSGGMIGLAIGDAVGFVVEGNPPSVVSSLGDSLIKWEREMGKEKRRKEGGGEKGVERLPKEFRSGYWAFGQYSDDTQLVREFLFAVVGLGEEKGEEERGLREEEIASSFAKRIASLYGEHMMVGCGLATSKALAQLLQEKSYKESGCEEGMAGNSPAVRGVGVGLVFGGWEGKESFMKKVAIEQCIVTHTDPLCKAGSVAMAYAIDYLFRNRKPLDPSDFIHQVAKETAKIDSYMGDCIKKALIFVEKKVQRMEVVREIMDMIPKKGKKTIFSNEKIDGVSGHVLPSILWAFFCFLSSPYNFMGVLVGCLKGGGDTDSTCALACALSGSYLGLSSLPPSLVYLVRDGERGGERELRELCGRVWGVRG